MSMEENRAISRPFYVRDSVFALATSDDMDAIYDLAVRLFGRAASLDQRRAWIAKEPRGHHVVKRRRDGKIMAAVSLLPIKHDRIITYLRDEIGASDLSANDIEPYMPGRPREVLMESILSDLAIPQLPHSEDTATLLRGVRTDLARLGREGVNISRVYARSSTPLAIAMSTRLGMQQWGPSRGDLCTFSLDVHSSDADLLQPYKQGFAEWRERNPEQFAFTRATPDDMEGVYEVAASLFEETTSAEKRKPLVARCPERYAFELDVASSDFSLLKPYREAIAVWLREYPGDTSSRVPQRIARKESIC